MSTRTRKKKISRTAFAQHAKRRKPGALHTIPSFCENNAISESLYYSLKREGRQPREIELDGRVLITEQAEEDWRREREAETMEKRKARSNNAADLST